MSDKEKIIVLGKTFDSDEDRRVYFREELRKRLPELRMTEGFPIGEDEDILNLSDPPYYTACPNPWLNEFVAEWEAEKGEYAGREDGFDVTEPYSSDVSEGKNNPIYNAHSYHTKVPHPAIMRYILHYTQPGDIVLDGFAGTGMTGVAAQLCGRPDPATRIKIENEWRAAGKGKPVWGPRRAIIGDLSPIASFIAYNYNTPVDVAEFEREAGRVLEEVEEECGWMYLTLGYENNDSENGEKRKTRDAAIQEVAEQIAKAKSPGEIRAIFDQFKDLRSEFSVGKMNYTVWSDVFTCSECGGEIIFWDAAFDSNTQKVRNAFHCPNCNIQHTKRTLEKTWITKYDKHLEQIIRQNKVVPVLINYSIVKKRRSKEPDSADLMLFEKIDEWDNPYSIPTDRMPEGDESRRNDRSGITHTHLFYTARNLRVTASIVNKSKVSKLSFFGSFNTAWHATIMRRYNPFGGDRPMSGTYYVGSIPSEGNMINVFEHKIRQLRSFSNYIKSFTYGNASLSTFTMSDTKLRSNSVDYIFTDPPFGANIMYSELNFLWESWLKVKTNNSTEAIQNKSQGKGFDEYQLLMTGCFREYYRVLKPGRWMTVEFSNTNAAIWNGIQTALQRAGFILANISALDKKQGSFKAVTTPTAVRQDLIISCYKPSEGFVSNFRKQTDLSTNVWEFVTEHLSHLPVHVANADSTTAVIERSPKILYDRVITFFIMQGFPVPIDAGDFQAELKTRFTERDGMYFTQGQAAEYETKKAELKGFEQLTFIVSNESEGIEWLRARLTENPMTYQDIQPDWMKAVVAVRKGDILPELRDILSENFIKEDGSKWRVPDMNEQKDRDTMRTKSLLRDFETYKTKIQKPKGRLKEVRVEALRAGFKHCWDAKDYATMVAVAERIPKKILEEDEFLLMYYDIAKDKVV